MSLVFKINGTDYGPGGLNLLQTFEPDLCGPGRIGQGVATLLQDGGGADIRTRMEVQAYEWNGSQVTAVYFGGFVGKRTTNPLPGSRTVKQWTLNLQDYNLLLLRLVCKAAWAQAIRFSGASFPSFAQQVAEAVRQLQFGASKTIDATSQVVDLALSGMPDQFFQGKNLQNILTKLTTDASVPGVAARWFIGPDYQVPRATFGDPMLYVYDANSPPVASMAFSDNPTGAQKTILFGPNYQRDVDAASQVNWRQGIHQASGGVYLAYDATSIATYPNPYDPEQAWKDEPLVTTEAIAGPAFQAELEARVADTANPRETLTQSVATVPPPIPGQWVTEDLALEGLSGDLYQVATSGAAFPGVGSTVVHSHLQLGLPRLLLGEFETTGNGTPVEGDTIPPDTPGSFTLASNSFNYTTGQANLTFTWAASTVADLDPVASYLLEVLVNGVRQRIITAALTATISMAPGATYAATVSSKDTSNNYSAPSSTLTGTAATGSVPSAPTWPGGSAWLDENGYDPATNTTRVRIHWNANAGGDHVLQYRAIVVDTASKNRQYLLDGGTTELLLPAEQPGVFRAFKVYAINIVGTSTVSATKTLTTSDTPPPWTGPMPYNGGFEIPTTDDATLPDGWTADTGFAITRDGTASAPEGSYALKLHQTTGSVGGATSRAVQVVGGAGYMIAYQVKVASSFPGFSMHEILINFYDNGGSNVGTMFQNRTAGTTWSATEFAMTAPATAVTATIEPLNMGAVDTYFDAIRFWRQIGTPDVVQGSLNNTHLAQGSPVAKADTTANRPGSPVTGQTYFDTTLGKPIWYKGPGWVDATGAAV